MFDTDWKAKYSAALRALEEDGRRAHDMEQNLRRVITRLCIAARGQAEELDAALGELSDANRRNADAGELANLAGRLRDSIKVVDDPGKRTGTQKALDSTSLSQTAIMRWAASCEAATLLLKQLARDDSTRGLVDTLIAELRGASTDDALAGVLTRVADALRARSDELERERAQANALLSEMASRLDEVTNYLSSQSVDRESALGDADKLNSAVLQQVDNLKSEVGSAQDIQRVRTLVADRLDRIATQAREYRDRQESRFLEQSALAQKMTTRIVELERQTSELHRSLHQEQKKARLDPLTGVPNRATFDERLADEIARWQRFRNPVSVLVWDLDRFKSINDTYGHRAGDRVLQEVANCFGGRLRATDVLARFGGEEFVMLLIGTTQHDAQRVANQLRQAVSELPFQFRDRPVKVTVSCGITELRDHDTAESVFDRADAALYRAKDGGRNLCVAA